MLGLDHIQELIKYLDSSRAQNQLDKQNLLSFFDRVFRSPAYQEWLADDQYWGARKPRGHPVIPFMEEPRLKRILDRFGLASEATLQVKIDSLGDRIHLTDGLWIDPSIRVFPFSDESQLISDYIHRNGYAESVNLFIDPACGCGHHALELRSVPLRLSLDVNFRALAFTRLNAILLGDKQHLVGINDIRDGLPREIVQLASGYVLFGVNMPFAIFPPDEIGTRSDSLAQNGGDRGIELTLAALKAIIDFAQANRAARPVRAVVLSYSLGRRTGDNGTFGDWELESRSRALLESAEVSGHVAFHLLPDEKLWRVNGKKQQDNPMPVSRLALKADCIHTYMDDERDLKREGYDRLAHLFEHEGYTHLGYGIVDLYLPAQ